MIVQSSAPVLRSAGYRTTIAVLSLGQIVCWAALYYAFTAFVLPMQHELGWSEPTLMGAYTAGLTVSALLSFAVGGAIDRGHGRAVMTLGPLLGALGVAFWALTTTFASFTFVAGAMWAHMAPALAGKGLGAGDTLTVLVCIGPAQVLGRLVFVVLGHRLSLRALGSVVLAGMPLGCLLCALGQGLAALLAFALLFGMANGMATLVRGGLLPDYFGRAALGRIGGAMSGVAQFARAFAPMAAAWVFVALPGYRELVEILAIVAAVGWIAFLFAGAPVRGLSR